MPSRMVPQKYFLTRGVGTHEDRLVSFELALRDARIPQFNLVTVSSILAPHCKRVSIEEGLSHLSAGEVVFCVLSRNESNQPGQTIASAVALVRGHDEGRHGYIAEHHAYELSEAEVGAYAERQAVVMLTTGMGNECDLPVNTEPLDPSDVPSYLTQPIGIAQSATIGEDGRWTTVISAAVFVLPEA